MVVDLGVGPVLREREREGGGAKVIPADQYRRRSAASSVLQRPMLSYFLSKSNAIRCTHSEKIILGTHWAGASRQDSSSFRRRLDFLQTSAARMFKASGRIWNVEIGADISSSSLWNGVLYDSEEFLSFVVQLHDSFVSRLSDDLSPLGKKLPRYETFV